MAVARRAAERWCGSFSDVQLLIVGHGDADQYAVGGPLAAHLRFLGQVDDAEDFGDAQRRRLLLRPTPAVNFGIVLVETDGRRHCSGQRPRRLPACAARR